MFVCNPPQNKKMTTEIENPSFKPSEVAFENHEINRAGEVREYFLSRTEVLSDPTIRRDYLSRMEPLDFIDEIQRIRTLVEDGDATRQHPFDGRRNGKEVETGTLQPPDQRDKEAILLETWGSVQKILNNNELTDSEALERAAVVAGIMVIVTHPFKQGNGRTSRTISYMMARGCGSDEEIKHILSSDGDEYWGVSPYREVHPASKVFIPSQLRPYLNQYLTGPQLEEYSAYHKPEDAASAPDAVQQQNNWRINQAAKCLALLDCIDENPQAPLTFNIGRVPSILAQRAHHLEDYVSYWATSDDPDANFFISTRIEQHQIAQSITLEKLQAAKLVLGEDLFDPAKTFSVLDQLVALHHFNSKIHHAATDPEAVIKGVQQIYKDITGNDFPTPPSSLDGH